MNSINTLTAKSWRSLSSRSAVSKGPNDVTKALPALSLCLASLCMWLSARHDFFAFIFPIVAACSQSITHSVPSDSEDMVSRPGLGKARTSPRDSHKASRLIGVGATGTSAGF